MAVHAGRRGAREKRERGVLWVSLAFLALVLFPGEATAATSPPQASIICSPLSVSLDVLESSVSSSLSCPQLSPELSCAINVARGQQVEGPIFAPDGGSTASMFTSTSTSNGTHNVITMCVNDTTFNLRPGFYQWSLTIAHKIDGTAYDPGILPVVEVNVTVADVNEAPIIDLDTINDTVTLPETAAPGFVVFSFTLTDPDTRVASGNSDYKTIADISFSSTNAECQMVPAFLAYVPSPVLGVTQVDYSSCQQRCLDTPLCMGLSHNTSGAPGTDTPCTLLIESELVTTSTGGDPSDLSAIKSCVQGPQNTSGNFFLRATAAGRYSVSLARQLNASETSRYIFNLTVTDGGGLSATSAVTIVIEDVNDKPVCASYDVIIDVDHTTAAGVTLESLNCWDPDVDPRYNVIEFSPQTLFSLLNISPVGHITLATQVTKDTVHHQSSLVRVFNPVNSTLYAEITVNLTVTEYPPQCSPGTNGSTFLPAAYPIGTCTNVLMQCTSPFNLTNGVNSTLSVSQSTNGPLSFSVSGGNISDIGTHTASFSICITDVMLNRTGTYEVTMNVSSSASSGTTFVNWTVNVEEVDRPPYFLPAYYNISVPENTLPQRAIASVVVVTSPALVDAVANTVAIDVITIIDPDTTSYEFASISVVGVRTTYPNSTSVSSGWDVAPREPIYLETATGPPYYFYAPGPLVVGTEYIFTLVLEGKQNNTDGAWVTFVVSDVNEPPNCGSGLDVAQVNLTWPLNHLIYVVSCSDNDTNVTLSSLTYNEYPTSDHDYFAIDSNLGRVTLDQRIPVNVSLMTYDVYVTDGGGLTTNFTLNINIAKIDPPTCLAPVPYPTLTELNSTSDCDVVTVVCGYQFGLQSYQLPFNLSLDYDQSLFLIRSDRDEQTSMVNISVCPATDLTGRAGVYQLNATLAGDPALGSEVEYQWEIRVQDVNQPPNCPVTYTCTANVTSPVGTLLTTVICTDGDIDEGFRNISYGEYQTSDFGYFDISPTGDVTLTTLVPIDVRRLQYDVFARDGGGLTTNTTVAVDVNRDFGPECSPSPQATATFQETDTPGSCSQTLVTCIDTSGRAPADMAVSVLTVDTQGILVNHKPGTTQGTLEMELCVTGSLLLNGGIFQIAVEVNNTFAVTLAHFNVTVVDVNQAPSFGQPLYEVTVPEVPASGTIAEIRSPAAGSSSSSSSTVVEIVMEDPDTKPDFALRSLSQRLAAQYASNGSDYEGTFSGLDPVFLSFRTVALRGTLRPDLVYFLKLTAEDHQGLSANTTLEVKVTDVNAAPTCPTRSPLTLDLLASPGAEVATVSCTDADYNVTFRSLRYFSYPERDHAYFQVDENGDVKLLTSLLRDSVQMVLKVYAEDGGGLRDNQTLTFNVDRNQPPDCVPSYVPPSGVWKYDSCFQVHPNCSDPTTASGDKQFLTYTFTGSWNNGFLQNVSVNDSSDYAQFCYFKQVDGNYRIDLNVTNGLGSFAWGYDVVVAYQKAPPRFLYIQYVHQIPENATLGTSIVTVQAVVNEISVALVYSFLDQGNFSQYFNIDSSSGAVSVKADLSPLVNQRINTLVVATDPATILNASVNLQVFVEDINDAPVCSPASMNVTVPWSITNNDVIATVACIDSDPSPAFSALQYSVDVGSDLWRSDGSAVRLYTRQFLKQNPTVDRYVITVRASDAFFTATTTVTINIDRTPPKPVLSLSNVTTATATVVWSFDPVYNDVITDFSIAITNSGSSSSSPPRYFRVTNDLASYVIAGLTPERGYRVNVTINGFQGSSTSDSVTFTTPAVAVLGEHSAEMKLTNLTWSNDLMNTSSSTFITVGSDISAAVHNELKGVLGYVSSRVRSFRYGSVYVDMVITTNQSLPGTTVIRAALQNLVRSGVVGPWAVDPSLTSFKFFQDGFYISDESLVYESAGLVPGDVTALSYIVTGYDVRATCSARTPGIPTPTFVWTLSERVVSSSSQRYDISNVTRSDRDPYKFNSTLTITGILLSEKGELVCTISGANNMETARATLRVRKKMIAVLSPPSAVVDSGSDVIFTCKRNAGYDVAWNATLYRLDATRVPVSTAVMTKSESQTNFTVRSLTSAASFRCVIRDSIASVYSKESDVIIKQKGATGCAADGDWQKTPAGETVKLSCPPDYVTGSIQSRTCGSNGQWQVVNTSECVRQELEDLISTVDQIQDGTTSNTTEEVVDVLENTTGGPLLLGDVTQAAQILKTVADINENLEPGENELEKFVKSADNILQASTDVWQKRTPEALTLVRSVDKMGKAGSKGLNGSSPTRRPINTNKIVLQVGRSNRSDIHFPVPGQNQDYPSWVTDAGNSAFLSKDAFAASGTVQYSAVIFRNLTNVFPGQLNDTLTTSDGVLSVNSPILSLSLTLSTVIQKPVRLTFDHLTSNFSSTSCQFLNFSASGSGMWSTDGCRVETSNSSNTVCLCDHLTNFAILMSPYTTVEEIANVLNIFSIVGCSVSILCLLATLVVYCVFWRHVRSDRSVVLMHLCVVLILAYVTFLAGVNRVEHEVVCQVVAGLLHYLWLVVFFLMLCEGLDIFISVVIIFPIKSVLTKLLLMAYGVPLVVVGVSMGVTQLDGYGGTEFCWLSVSSGLLWAFVGPALVALAANFVFVAFVIRALLSTTAMITKARREQTKSVLKAICVMTPILGLTWIFGVMAVNEDTLVFQILFVVFNSLQGLMIFILHCLLSKQIREGMKSKKRRYLAQSGSTDDQGSKYGSGGKKSSTDFTSSGNDLDKKTISPFLQVDRQVQQMASKVARLDTHNLMVSADPPKAVPLKSFVAGATAAAAVDTPPAERRNIQLNESSTDGYDTIKGAPVTGSTLGGDPELRIEAGNLKTPSGKTLKLTQDPSPSPASTVHHKMSLTKTASIEDNTASAVVPRLNLGTSPQASRSSASSKASKQSSQPTSAQGGDSYERPRERRESKKKVAKRTSQEELQQERLDHVYGAGARMSGEDGRQPARPSFAKSKGNNSSQSSGDVRGTSKPRNPVYSDAVPAFSPTDVWVRRPPGAPTTSSSASQLPGPPVQLVPHHHIHPRTPLQPHPPPSSYAAPAFPRPRPSSPPRRLAASAESLGSSQPPFAGNPNYSDPRRQGNVNPRNVSHSRRAPPPGVAPKPGGGRGGRKGNEPPVDYW